MTDLKMSTHLCGDCDGVYMRQSDPNDCLPSQRNPSHFESVQKFSWQISWLAQRVDEKAL